MEHFVHLFEFLAGVNSAYIVSSSFFDNLVKIVQRPFENTAKEISNCKERCKNYIKLVNKLQTSMPAAARNDLEARLRETGTKINKCEEDFNSEKELGSIPEYFNLFATYGALFSITFLICVGFDFHFRSSYAVGIALTVFLFLSVVSFAIFYFRARRFKSKHPTKTYYPSHGIVILCFLTAIGLSSVCYIIIKSWCPISNKTLPDFYYYFNAIASICIPIVHFVVYSVKARIKIQKKVNQVDRNVNSLTIELDGIFTEIKVHFKYNSDGDFDINGTAPSEQN